MEIKFGKKFIGDIHPTFIVAEMSANHNGDKRKAIEMIHVAKDMGADAIKLQTYSADSMTLEVNNKDFNLLPESPWAIHKNLWNLYTKGSTPYDWHEDLFKEARNIDLEIFSTPFDEYGVDFLMDLGVSAFKIASPEINHIPLLKKICETGKPIILSSGVADLKDITLAIDTIRNNQHPARRAALNEHNDFSFTVLFIPITKTIFESKHCIFNVQFSTTHGYAFTCV